MARIRVGGDLGDAVYSLPVIKATPGGPHDVFFVERRPTVAPFLERERIIRPLYEAQPYIRSVTLAEDDVDLDLTTFRRNHSWRYTLPVAQKMEAERQGIDMSAFDQKSSWLTAPAVGNDRVLIHRSPRYNNPHFPWATLIRHFGKRCLFTGLAFEHAKFEKDFGVTVEHALPANLLELSILAAGAQLCIGNQSSPFSVFEGLKVPRILEVCLWQPDCVFPPDGKNFCVADGCIEFEGFRIPPSLRQFAELNPAVTPPGLWQYEQHKSAVFDLLARDVAKEKGLSKEEVASMVYLTNCERRPDFFRNRQNDGLLARFHGAAANVGYPLYQNP